MAFTMNLYICGGNLTRDPEVTYSPSGTAICKTGLAINGRKKEGDKYIDVPQFFDITSFGKLAERMGKALKKGDNIQITGRLETDHWEDKNGGGKRSKVHVIASDCEFVKWGKDRQGGSAADAGGGEEAPF